MRILIIAISRSAVSDIERNIRDHYVVDVACNTEEGLILADANFYDGIVLDTQLRDAPGIDVCSTLRNEGIQSPILILLDPGCDGDKVRSLDAGADMFLVKPFDSTELLAKMRAIMRKNCDHINSSILRVHDLHLDFQKKIIKRGEKEIHLRRKEFDLLEYLIRNKGVLVSKEALLEHIWDKGLDVESNTVEVHVSRLRNKLGRKLGRKLITTVNGYGYKINW